MIIQLSITTFITILCVLNLTITCNYYGLVSIYGQGNDSDNIKNITELNNNSVNRVKVDDIDIAYKKSGNGEPLILIMGYSGSKNDWDPIFLNKLSANHTVIVFDNRGVGNTTNGTKNFSIVQFAEDTKGLLDALKINKSNILGYSMGGMIAQELTLNHKDKVDDLIIYASHCGHSDLSFYPPEEFRNQFSNLTGKEEDIKNRFVPYEFPTDWKIQNSVKYNEIFASLDLPSNETLQKQIDAMYNWIKNGGSCDRLKDTSQDTLIVVGSEDLIIPPKNSLLLKQKIPSAELVQFENGGHALMFQFPHELSAEVNKFLKN